ncbi:hypothetical protein ACWCQQ_40050 [Streptomyces sp. NPDC002143]
MPRREPWPASRPELSELIDRILTSHRMFHRLTAAGTGTAAGPRLPSVGAGPATRRNEPGSDHAPVWVRIG